MILTKSPTLTARRFGRRPPVNLPAAPPVIVGRLAGSVQIETLLICTSMMVVPEPPEAETPAATLRICPSDTAIMAASVDPACTLVETKPLRKPWMWTGSATA